MSEREPFTAIEVAVLVKMLSTTDGADLIERYARCVAAGAALDSTREARAVLDNIFNLEVSHAQA